MQRQPYLTPEQYLEIERKAETKSEYHAGEMFAMAGASREHNRIVLDLGAGLNGRLNGAECEAFVSDMRVKIPMTGLYTYPDVVIVCGNAQYEDSQVDTLLNPRVIVEVLSQSTEAYDRGLKFEQYRTLESLQEYVLVAQDRPKIDLYRREPEGWMLREFSSLESVLQLSSAGCSVPLSEIYRRVEFEQPSNGSPNHDRPTAAAHDSPVS